MKLYSFLFLFLISTTLLAQESGYQISYLRSSNGKIHEKQSPILVYANKDQTAVTSQQILDGKARFPYERYFVNRKNGAYYKISTFEGGREIATVDSALLDKQKLVITGETKKILGYTVKKATTSVNSNTIDLWFTEEPGIKGSPVELGQNLGLVLEMVRNGNSAITATKMEKIKSIPASIRLQESGSYVDELTYRDLLWKSRFVDIPVFYKQRIRFNDATRSDSILRFANGTVIVKKVKIPELKKNEGQAFVEVIQQAKGDAYDRTGSVFLIPADRDISFLDGMKNGMNTLPAYENGNGKKYQGMTQTANFEPVLELMRFFTPFGVSQFNYIKIKGKTWQDSVSYRQEISELLPRFAGKEVYIGTYIGNYDKEGHEVTVRLTIHPGKPQFSEGAKVLSLFNTTNVMEMGGQEYPTMFNQEKGVEVKFTLDQDVKNAQLRYITTGHGGWGEGDEFVPKANTIFLDGQQAFKFTPWRTECGSYRLSNPASGNFENGLSSSDLSRSNWCPGTVTNPIYIDLGDLKAGEHTIRVHIPQGEPEGTSLSYWNVSGALLYY
ncbi:PNGase F N-terminal domain-containing protein [Sphingobacterium spiritivorum]|uniref:PNGase F N-terminal domain-containing protein n=1 Tax=Sphingobacterium spiritivorum TaxID=258 RepID=UPI00191AC1A4|nr:PNGase F N-terminal domain-containing protein [Sphingobacterium spiritivorum]QQT25775.1 peptide-N-glycosidase [Sphingobacterium spiritivorum]